MLADRLGRTQFASLSIEPIHLKSNGERIALKTKNANNISVYLVPKVPVNVKSSTHFIFILSAMVRMIETIVVNHTRKPHVKFIK